MNNFIPGRYRGVSVQSFDVPLDAEHLQEILVGREAYRTTEFLVARRGSETALLRVTKKPGSELFLPIAEVEVIAPPGECAFVQAPDVDTGVPTQMANAAKQRASGARCVVVHGMYEHINFILDPRPVPVRVVDVAPPWPPKLADQARRVLETAESLPPVELRPAITDLVGLASNAPSEHYPYPCRGSGAAPAGAEVSYLDERPPHQEWTLVGCARSRQIHSWVYGEEPPYIELCPRKLAVQDSGAGETAAEGSAGEQPPAGVGTLTKCCLLESGIEVSGSTVTVPWGASLAEVYEGLRALLAVVEPAWSPV
jgi:hypothetical protein